MALGVHDKDSGSTGAIWMARAVELQFCSMNSIGGQFLGQLRCHVVLM